MSFNTKYILPGDDKNQIISKVNQNFSQVYYAGVGLQGEKGVVGPTGIIGQVGKNGPLGPTGTRANVWIFQDEPPGIYSVYPTPLENYDVWVNTSPTGSTGGPNRIYRFNSTYAGGAFGYYWIDTGENFISAGTFTQIQSAVGPSNITEKNVIIAATANSTFVFSDNEVTTTSANPTYSKALISNRGFTTAELPLFTFGKTFYQSSGPPSFIWKNITDYSIEFSSDETIFIESQATGFYSSTGGTLGITAGRNVIVNTSAQLGITGPSGIFIDTSSFGVSSPNFSVGNTVSFPSQSGGFVIGASSALNALTVENSSPPQSNDNRQLTVLNFSGGPSGGVLRPNINLSMGESSLFRINNASSGSYPALSIGYTSSQGITGPSGGTGANIYKSYQTVTSPATSRARFGPADPSNPSNVLSNYITVTPTSDVIRVVPEVPSGVVPSSNGRVGRIWIAVSGVQNYVESSNASEIDIFLDISNASGTYSIGGIAIRDIAESGNPFTLSGYGSTQVFYIEDEFTASTLPGTTLGCRHVKITFFGDSFPSNVNINTTKKYAFVRAFVSDQSMSQTIQKETWIPYSNPIGSISGSGLGLGGGIFSI